MMRTRLLAPAFGATLLLAAGSAGAHDGSGVATAFSGAFAAGFAHPLSGWDHVAAMLAVGLWATQLGRPARWSLPIAFLLAMALGGVLGAAGVALPAVDAGIAASAVVLGALIAFAVTMPVVPAIAGIAVFAVFHGHAHGSEAAAGTGMFAYTCGFVAATGVLHATGVGIGLAVARSHRVVRMAGAAMSFAGLAALLA